MNDFRRNADKKTSTADSATTEISQGSVLISTRDLAGELRISIKTVIRLVQAGKLPAPLYIGRQMRWPRAEIMEWIAAGAPPRREWDRIRKAAR